MDNEMVEVVLNVIVYDMSRFDLHFMYVDIIVYYDYQALSPYGHYHI